MSLDEHFRALELLLLLPGWTLDDFYSRERSAKNLRSRSLSPPAPRPPAPAKSILKAPGRKTSKENKKTLIFASPTRKGSAGARKKASRVLFVWDTMSVCDTLFIRHFKTLSVTHWLWHTVYGTQYMTVFFCL